MDGRWRIELLGGLRAVQGERAITHFRTQKTGLLLAYLALTHSVGTHRQRAHRREELIELFWPESEPAAGRNSLSTALAWLRRSLQPGAVDGQSSRADGKNEAVLASPSTIDPLPSIVLVADRDSVQLHPAAVTTDVAAFKAALRSAARTESRAERAGLLAQAVDGYRGELLPGFQDDWILQERQWLAELYFQALGHLITHLQGHGEFQRALEYAHRGVRADPLREEMHRELIRLYAALGQHPAARRRYDELERLLKKELGAAPSAATRRLVEEIDRLAVMPRPPLGVAPPSAPLLPAAQEGSSLRPPGASLSPLPPRPVSLEDGENRLVTVLFADMSHSVQATTHLIPEEAAALMSRLLTVMVDVVLKYEGRVDRFLGDGLLALFGVPQVHEDDPERAVRAALEIREAARHLALEVTAGINTGAVYVGPIGSEKHQETTAVGPAVNLASRLQGQAEPGQILVGEATYRQTRRAFECAPLVLSVKGMAQPVKAYVIERAMPRPEKARGIEGLRAALIGRDEEFARLQEAWGEVVRGRGQVVSVIGEAGVGKSRLVAELRSGVQAFRRSGVQAFGFAGIEHEHEHEHEHRPNAQDHRIAAVPPERLNARTPERLVWLEGRCLELSMATSYAPFLDLFREHFGLGAEEDDRTRAARLTARLERLAEAGRLSRERIEEIALLLARLLAVRFGDARDEPLLDTDPGELKRQTFLAIRDYLIALAREQPLVLVLEDLHWADHLSLELIPLLLGALPQAPLLLLCLYRPERESTRSAGTGCWRLGAQAQQQCRERYTEISLRELAPADSRRLVESLLPGTRAAGGDNLPERVKELILAKARGNPFFVEEVVRSLVDACLVYREGDLWRAKDEIEQLQVPETIQSVILSRVDRLEPELKQVLESASVIGRLFRKRVLERVVASDQWPVAREGGRLGSSSPELTTDHWPPAAALSQLEERQLIYEARVLPEAEYSFNHVLTQETIYDSLLKDRRARFHRQVAEALEALYPEDLEEHYEPLAHHCERGGEHKKAIEYLLKAGERALHLSADAEAIQHFQRALWLLDDLPQDEAHLRLRWEAAAGLERSHWARLEWERARQALEEYLARAERAGFAWGMAHAHQALAWHLRREIGRPGDGEIELARRHAETSLALCEREGLADLLPMARYHLADWLRREPGRDLPRAEALLCQALDAREGLDPAQVQGMFGQLARVYAKQGRWEAVMAALRESLAAGGLAVIGVYALNQMEEGMDAQGRRAAFTAFCEERPLAQTRTAGSLAQWYLAPAEPCGRLRQVAFQDDFEGTVLHREWQWCDPLQVSAYSLAERAGCVTLRAADGSDLYPRSGFNAPCLLLEVRGDFALEARMDGDWDTWQQIGSSGLLVWKDVWNFVRLEKFCMDEIHYGSIQLEAMVHGEYRVVGRGLLRGNAFHLRLEREGERFTALCSADGVHWLTCGQVAFPARDPLLVGIACLRGMVAHFDRVRVLTRP